MKKIFKVILMLVILIIPIGCGKNNNDLKKSYIGKWKCVEYQGYDVVSMNYNFYMVLYEGGTGSFTSNLDELETTGYAPQPLKWEIEDEVLNVTYTLTNKTESYKLDKKENKIIGVNVKTTYEKIE